MFLLNHHYSYSSILINNIIYIGSNLSLVYYIIIK